MNEEDEKKKCDENECERETGESERACDYI